MNAAPIDETDKTTERFADRVGQAVSQQPLTDNERLLRSNPFEVTRVTCSKEAADYAYLHFPSPMTAEWRAASAGYDEGVAKGKIDGLNKAWEMEHYANRLENDLKGQEEATAEALAAKDHLIEGLEKGLKAAEAVINGLWDAREMGVDQKAQERFAEAREVVDRYWEENLVIPESSVVEDTPAEDIGDWPTLAKGPIEPDTRPNSTPADIDWLEQQIASLQLANANLTQARNEALAAEQRMARTLNEATERGRKGIEDAYRRGWRDAFQRSTPVQPATPSWPTNPMYPQIWAGVDLTSKPINPYGDKIA